MSPAKITGMNSTIQPSACPTLNFFRPSACHADRICGVIWRSARLAKYSGAMRNAPSMRLERKKITMALMRSNLGESGLVPGALFPGLRLTTSTIQGTSVRMIPRKVCCIVQGASPDFCSTNESSLCFICHYSIG